MNYEIILYYKFSPIENPEIFAGEHTSFCKKLGLKGRIYIGTEGINGTLGGAPKQINEYKNYVTSIEGFEDVDFKTDTCDEIPFAKLKCKTRDEIVALHAEADTENGGNYLSSDQWKQIMESGEDYVMIDVRNDYESKIGHFEGAITPQVENFYDFPEWLDHLQADKEKKY